MRRAAASTCEWVEAARGWGMSGGMGTDVNLR
jgi:hypothetical protein